MSRVTRLAFCFDPNRDFDRAVHIARIWSSDARWALGVDEDLALPGKLDTEGRRKIAKHFARADVSILLVGRDSISSDWVHAELERIRKLPLIQIFVDGIPDRNGRRDARGKSPLELHRRPDVLSFEWESDKGEANLLAWIDAALQLGRRGRDET